jgi:hypothetical protein
VAHQLLGADRLSTCIRKVLLIAAVAIGLVLAAAATVFSSGPPWVLDADGVMMPDSKPRPTPTPAGYTNVNAKSTNAIAIPRKPGTVIVTAPVSYSYVQKGSSTTFLRNGQPWLTITKQTGGGFNLSDPNGSGSTIIRVAPKH